MSFDLVALEHAVARHGRVARVVIAEAAGSAPREQGCAMLVWDGGQAGTIGGGRLELDAADAARRLAVGQSRCERIPLGPALGQCCGGAVTLVTEVFDAATLATVQRAGGKHCVARPVGPTAGPEPLSVSRRIAGLRNGSQPPVTSLVDGWLVEPIAFPAHQLWIFGAGHVGRAVVSTMASLPDWRITWVDTAVERFPDPLPENVDPLVAGNPAEVVRHAAADAHHLVMTYSHALDLEICHALLAHRFGSAGLIGSATKWARFRSRLRQLGHVDASILRIACPIGDPRLGKAPQAIAVGVAAQLLGASIPGTETARDRPA